MEKALKDIVILPYALVMDAYVQGLYNGSIPESKANEGWWRMRQNLQGISSPIQRSEDDFDAGAKVHFAMGIPYFR